MKTNSSRSIIPGFGLSFGVTVTVLSLVVLLPLCSLVVFTAKLSFSEFIYTITRPRILFDVFALEEAMQKVMDEYAGGIRTGYRYNTGQLNLAGEKIAQLTVLADTVTVEDPENLYRVYELRDRLTVCRTLLSHMQERTETRWPGFGIHTDYPERDDNSLYFVNSVLKDGKIHVFRRPL